MNNLNSNQVDQPLETPRKVFQIDQRHLWKEKKTCNPQNTSSNTDYS
jgi:hypothetical protein